MQLLGTIPVGQTRDVGEPSLFYLEEEGGVRISWHSNGSKGCLWLALTKQAIRK